ncbi:MAG TPA: dihydrolipoyl dehydrogenase [Acidobacteriota bacterium]|jgi:dihydrolipoamide dehydrogenase|nr:dihydrolipoyl dehydrogenase [Acidobacteriota bacterium]
MSTKQVDALVIGGGPGGYAVAIRLAQLGQKTALVEKERLGGVCLNVGCIPSKALISASKLVEKFKTAEIMGISAGSPKIDMRKMQQWKSGIVDKLTGGVAHLCKGNNVEVIQGTARFKSKDEVEISGGGTVTVRAKNFVIATGSRPVELKGFEFGDRILSSTEALALAEVPKKLAVLGGGYIGLELGTMYAKLGAQVTVVEMMDQLLPGFDPEIVRVLAQKLKKQGVTAHVNAKATGVEKTKGGIRLSVQMEEKNQTIEADYLLVTVGRRPNSENLSLEAAGVKVDSRGFIPVDKTLRSNVSNIYAIGDVIGNPMLAHKASREAEVAAEVIAGKSDEVDYRAIPAVVFTDPEVATTGLSEKEAQEKGHKTRIGKFPFAASGRAMSVNEADGFVKIVIDEQSKEVLGVHIIGPDASDLIAEATLAIEMGAYAEDIALTIHAHPTLSEAVMEAAKVSIGEAVHVLNK